MLRFNNLSYSYKGHADALAGVSGSVGPGLCLVLGENGAGKTTLLNLCAGVLLPSAGSIDFDGCDPSRRLPSTLERLFFLPADYVSPLATIDSAAEHLAPFYPNFDAAMLRENLDAFGLSGREKLRRLSLGLLHKANIAFALALRTDLLLLDEPANGLDILSKKELRHRFSRCLGDNQTVLLSTHTVADLEVLYDSVLLLHQGRLLLNATTEHISERLSFATASVPPPGALYVEPDAGAFRVVLPAEEAVPTAVDFELLYTAILNDPTGRIVELLNTPCHD